MPAMGAGSPFEIIRGPTLGTALQLRTGRRGSEWGVCCPQDCREINNTDAEGRLVLADGRVLACKDLGADIILDATLTGAQSGPHCPSCFATRSELLCEGTGAQGPWTLEGMLAQGPRAGPPSRSLSLPCFLSAPLLSSVSPSRQVMLSTSLPHRHPGHRHRPYHAAVLTNSAEWEAACVKAGRQCGGPGVRAGLLPGLHFSEFTSAVADMKNSVAVGVEQVDLGPLLGPSLGSEQGRGEKAGRGMALSLVSPRSMPFSRKWGVLPLWVPIGSIAGSPFYPQGEGRPPKPSCQAHGDPVCFTLHTGPSTPGPFLQTLREVVAEDRGQEGAGYPPWPPTPRLEWKLMTAFYPGPGQQPQLLRWPLCTPHTIGFDWPGVWVHLDIAAPVHRRESGPWGHPAHPPLGLPWPAATLLPLPAPPLGSGCSHSLLHPEPLSGSEHRLSSWKYSV